MNITIEVQGYDDVLTGFDSLRGLLADVRPLWPRVNEAFEQIEREQFDSEGAIGASGPWAALSDRYRLWKERFYPGAPILFLTGELKESLVSRDSIGAVYREGADFLERGTEIPYATIHQDGGGIIPSRPPISMSESQQLELMEAFTEAFIGHAQGFGFEIGL